MTQEQRWQWGQLHNQTLRAGGGFINDKASESLREDFGECLHEYMHDSARLRRYDEERYNFIDTIYKEVNE